MAEEKIVERTICADCNNGGKYDDSKVCPSCGQEGYFHAIKIPTQKQTVHTQLARAIMAGEFESIVCTGCMGSGCGSCSNTGSMALVKRRDLSQHEPPPQINTNPAVWDLVKIDLAQRDDYGLKKYKTRLQPHNGRDTLVDLYQELLDAVVYTRQLIFERDGK